MADHSGPVKSYPSSLDPQLILVLNEDAAVWSAFFSSAHLFRIYFSFRMYFIFDQTEAPCQCSVLINRVESLEWPSLSPILFQRSLGSAQSLKGSTQTTRAECGSVTECLAQVRQNIHQTLHPCMVIYTHSTSV